MENRKQLLIVIGCTLVSTLIITVYALAADKSFTTKVVGPISRPLNSTDLRQENIGTELEASAGLKGDIHVVNIDSTTFAAKIETTSTTETMDTATFAEQKQSTNRPVKIGNIRDTNTIDTTTLTLQMDHTNVPVKTHSVLHAGKINNTNFPVNKITETNTEKIDNPYGQLNPDTGIDAVTKSKVQDGKASRERCQVLMRAYLLEPITDERLLQLHKACRRKPDTTSLPIVIGPELVDAIFRSDIFQTTCGKRNISFNNGRYPQFAALPSVPGSGNTWSRILLEDMTGLYTGSTATDNHCKDVLIGSKMCPVGNTIIVKTHHSSYNMGRRCNGAEANVGFKSAIYLVRNPYNAILAEFNRHHGGKVAVADRAAFESSDWKAAVSSIGRGWNNHVSWWLKQTLPIHVLVYEQLQKHTLWELYMVAKFLDFPVQFKSLWCIKHRSDMQSRYFRQKPEWLKPELLYSQEQKRMINRYILGQIRNVTDKYNVTRQFRSYILE